MAASASQSESQQQSTQLSTQGASGANSPTISAGGGVSYNDPALELAALSGARDAILAALNGTSGVSQYALEVAAANAAAIAQNGAAQSSADSDLLSAVLSANSQLATAQGTGGASLTYNTNNNLIWGLIALAAAAILGLFHFRK